MSSPPNRETSPAEARDRFVRRARLRSLLGGAEAAGGDSRNGWIRVRNDPDDGNTHVVLWADDAVFALEFDHDDPTSCLAGGALTDTELAAPPARLELLGSQGRSLLGVAPTSMLWIVDGHTTQEGTTDIFDQYIRDDDGSVARWLERDALDAAQSDVIRALEAALIAGDATLGDRDREILLGVVAPAPLAPPRRPSPFALTPSEKAMFEAVVRDDAGALATALASGVRIEVRHPGDRARKIPLGETAATLAARQHRPALVRLLLEAGADVGRYRDLSLLEWAAHHGDPDLCAFLLARGATLRGEPLRHAAHGGSVDVVRALLRAGAPLPPPPSLERLFEIADAREDADLRAALMARTEIQQPTQPAPGTPADPPQSPSTTS